MPMAAPVQTNAGFASARYRSPGACRRARANACCWTLCQPVHASTSSARTGFGVFGPPLASTNEVWGFSSASCSRLRVSVRGVQVGAPSYCDVQTRLAESPCLRSVRAAGARAPTRQPSLPFALSLSKGECEGVLLDAVPACSCLDELSTNGLWSLVEHYRQARTGGRLSGLLRYSS